MSETSTKTYIDSVFDGMMANYREIGMSQASERKTKLKRLHDALLDNKDKIREAMYKDFRKHPTEVDLTEIFPVTSEIKYIRKRLSEWMTPQRVPQPLLLLGSNAYVQYRSKGVVLIISPWNFPVTLTLGPLAAAIAAGNCAILKPSEHTPQTSAVMRKILHSIFPENEIRLIEGEVDTAKALLEKPFHHIYFTGSPSVGREIMSAAARHLASVTLELGGKSPTIIDSSANLKTAVKRITWGKFINNGQICLSPDYILVEKKIKERFIEAMLERIREFYGHDPSQAESYCRVINESHVSRLRGYVGQDDRVIQVGDRENGEQTYFPPTLLIDPGQDHPAMQEEIFGPVLPIIEFSNKEEVSDIINSRARPLGIYIYSNRRAFIRHIINNTRSGSLVVNHSVVHYFNSHLPFGGANNSGIGRSGGFAGFKEFSVESAIMKQWFPVSALRLLVPPYSKFKQRITDLAIKWF